MIKSYIDEWKNYFDFSGRVRRRYLWRFLGINTLISFLFIGIDIAYLFLTGFEDKAELAGKLTNGNGLLPFSSIFATASIIPMLKVFAKRFHDLNKTGWFVLISFIPVLGYLYVSLVTLFFKGTSGPNKFGGDPKDPDNSTSQKDLGYEDKRSFDHKRLDIVRNVFDKNLEKGVSVKKISKVLESRGYEKDEISEGLKHYKETA